MSNLDEITAARKKRRRKYHLKRGLRAVLLLLVLAAVVFVIVNVQMTTFKNLGDWLKVTFSGGGGFPVALGSGRPLQMLPLSGTFATLTESELIVTGNGGKALQRVQHGYTDPVLFGNGGKLMVVAHGGRDFSVYNRTGELFSSETEYAIISADIASNGVACVLTRGDRTTSELKVYSGGNYTHLFTWYGAKGFPLLCSISERGDEIAVVSLTVSSNGIRSIFTVIDVASKEQRAELELDGTVLRVYRSGGRYIVVTEQKALLLDASLDRLAEYSFSKMPILSVAMDRGNHLAVAFGDNNQPDINYILLLSDRLEELAVLDDVGTVRDLYVTQDRLHILSDGEVLVVQNDGTAIERYHTDIKAEQVFLVKNRVTVLLPDRVEQPERVKEEQQ